MAVKILCDSSMDLGKEFYEKHNIPVMPYFAGENNEALYAIAIDSKNKVIDVKLICEGVVDEASVNMRVLTQFLISSNATNFILAHNHPDGSCMASVADDKTTRSIVLNTEINGIRMLDHIIVGCDDTYSYHHSGKLDEYREVALKLCNGQRDLESIAKYEVRKWKILQKMIMVLSVQIVAKK